MAGKLSLHLLAVYSVTQVTGFGILFFPMFAVFCLTVLSMLLNVFFAIKENLSERQSKK